jgi:1-deoxy-D-xylulose 5-phosphate reductoisomerase
MKRVLLLGATGSIGRSTLKVLRELRDSHLLVVPRRGTTSRVWRASPNEFGLEHVAIASERAAEIAARCRGHACTAAMRASRRSCTGARPIWC